MLARLRSRRVGSSLVRNIAATIASDASRNKESPTVSQHRVVNARHNDQTERTCHPPSPHSQTYPGSGLSVEQLVYVLTQALGSNLLPGYPRYRVIVPTRLFVQKIARVGTTEGPNPGDLDMTASLMSLLIIHRSVTPSEICLEFCG